MGGAKGMVGFMLNDVSQNYPAQQARQEAIVQELQTVRSLVLYGETLANTTMTVNGIPSISPPPTSPRPPARSSANTRSCCPSPI